MFVVLTVYLQFPFLARTGIFMYIKAYVEELPKGIFPQTGYWNISNFIVQQLPFETRTFVNILVKPAAMQRGVTLPSS